MLANLNREDFIELLKKLGAEGDDEVLASARDLHARITVAGISWDELLVPEQSDDESEDELEDEADYEDDGGESEDQADYEGDEEEEEDDGADDVSGDDDDDDDDDEPLSDELKKEAEGLITAIGALDISAATREDLDEYKKDLTDGDFEQMDLDYLRALRGRLSK
ncbi:MAG: hypothetical protein QGH73_14470 [Rhodospirillales bacterium]|jgi:hypothetical protein|nr:hypothetical protein [Rhodospirillaceae bacterium]MDP6429254.1 hypothetical protein [Rhodospirillales bacterium]MDP6643479.1 hypothetical protein [Rhodospirillales bacterium]MDP6842873.1 hypothetical protein [Rhodospirillales bacterium]|tara:strand:- start:585 stop:1082 length:498 start_codon:yes stop_codon:yes gene_type:complete